MEVKVSRHIFGSKDGYKTLAKSADVLPIECAQLEDFSYGQTNDSAYLKSLTTMWKF